MEIIEIAHPHCCGMHRTAVLSCALQLAECMYVMDPARFSQLWTLGVPSRSTTGSPQVPGMMIGWPQPISKRSRRDFQWLSGRSTDDQSLEWNIKHTVPSGKLK